MLSTTNYPLKINKSNCSKEKWTKRLLNSKETSMKSRSLSNVDEEDSSSPQINGTRKSMISSMLPTRILLPKATMDQMSN